VNALRFWMAACWLLACALAVFGGRRLADDLFLELPRVPKPAGWRNWPELPDRGGFALESSKTACAGHRPDPCTWAVLLYEGRRGWPPPGARLDDDDVRDVDEPLTVRASGSIAVAETSGRFVVAFDTAPAQTPLGLRRNSTKTVLACIGGALALLVAAMAWAAALVARSRAFLDAARFRRGRRDARGTISFDDGTAPIVSSQDGPEGPVLVEVTDVEEGSYRAAPATRAGAVHDGDGPAVVASRRTAAAGILGATFIVAAFLGAIAFVAVALERLPVID
jgi:hypothetical protein